ncbi:sensor histidine kinase [Dyadobacter helix]|uniref:sensor histidine kinase n=1 Tax=Dyadobacter helix TaxID=2822344 RepID=UPI001E40466E|nr:histidine kinase [Dyadobacter sp. CECT 9275]
MRSTTFVQRLLSQSGLPLTIRQFWLYSFCYWSIFASITFVQLTMLWLLKEGDTMNLHEVFIWLLDGLFWWSTTPLVLYASLKIPIVYKAQRKKLLVPVFYHLLIVTFLNILINSLHYLVTNPVMFWLIGKSIPAESYLFSFFVAYTASFGQYMLLVVGFNKVSYIYRYQALQKEHFKTELANEQLRGQLANAQLQALKMQLNPHFLFNTLHAVIGLMIKSDIKKATLMITTLSDLLRVVLANRKTDYITFGEELRLTRQYLEIQRIRFEDRLKVQFEIDPASEPYPVPQLILQPLVENSFTHGIADLTTEGVIRISTHVDKNGLQIEVSDNGVGSKKRREAAGMGLGLENTLLRIQQAYGPTAKLTFNQPLKGGTIVTLFLPGEPQNYIPQEEDFKAGRPADVYSIATGSFDSDI